MMTSDRQKSTQLVYRSFLSNDYARDWTDTDEKMWELDFLSDDQLILEVECQLYRHSLKDLKCDEEHRSRVCLVPDLMESVNGICELWNETKSLHIKNKYVLQNYLVASNQGILYVENSED